MPVFTKPLFLMILVPTFAWAGWFSHEEIIFGTGFEMTYWTEDEKQAREAIEQVTTEMWRLHHMLSPYEEDSELSRLNQNAFDDVFSTSEELAMLLEKALFCSELSGGAFDPSFASLGRYYDYQAGDQPAPEMLDELKKQVDYRQIALNRAARVVQFSNQHMYLDLGGLAKGYAMDRAAETLKGLGVKNATVSAGGDMRVLGDRRGRPWIVGIRNPRAEETAIRLPLEDTAVSTSGDYERFFIDEVSGERIHHILDPETGKSASELTSVTILGERGLDTDPLSTAVFVMGVEEGLKLINSLPQFDAILIDKVGKVHFSNGLMAP